MSEVVDDNYGEAHAVCKFVIEEGGRVAVAVVVVVGGSGGGGGWWLGQRAGAVCDSSPGRDHLSAPVATVCKILARFSNSLTSNLIDGIFEHFVMVSLQIENEIFHLNC